MLKNSLLLTRVSDTLGDLECFAGIQWNRPVDWVRWSHHQLLRRPNTCWLWRRLREIELLIFFLIIDEIFSYFNNRLLEIINVVLNGRWRSATISALGLAACSWQSSLARLSNLVFCLRICNQKKFKWLQKRQLCTFSAILQCKIHSWQPMSDKGIIIILRGNYVMIKSYFAYISS